jgi:hypothetical protein
MLRRSLSLSARANSELIKRLGDGLACPLPSRTSAPPIETTESSAPADRALANGSCALGFLSVGAVTIGAAKRQRGQKQSGPATDPPSADRPEQTADLSALVGDRVGDGRIEDCCYRSEHRTQALPRTGESRSVGTAGAARV